MSSLTLPLEFANDGVQKGVLGRNVSPSNRHDVLFQWDQKVQQVPLQLVFIYKSAKYRLYCPHTCTQAFRVHLVDVKATRARASLKVSQ